MQEARWFMYRTLEILPRMRKNTLEQVVAELHNLYRINIPTVYDCFPHFVAEEHEDLRDSTIRIGMHETIC